MANIERRRKIRLWIPIIIAAGAAVTTALIVVLIFTLIKGRDNKEAVLPTEPAPVETTVPSQALTDEPTSVPTAEPTMGTPVRVSDEVSFMLLSVDVLSSMDEEGTAFKSITGIAAVEFVNNTDILLYSADFKVGGMAIDGVTLNGVSTCFSVTDDGVLTVPFLDVLEPNGVCTVFFKFSLEEYGESFSIPVINYDTAFELKAVITSDSELTVPDAEAANESNGYSYQIDGVTVRGLTVSFARQ